MVDKKKRPRRRKVVKASDKKGGASATASSTVIVNVGGRRSRKPPTTLATFRPPSVAFTQPQIQPQFTSDNVKTAVGEALKTALPKFYQIGEDMPTRYMEPQIPTVRPSMETQTDNTKTMETQTTGQQTHIRVPQRPNISAREEAPYFAFPVRNPGTVPIVGDEDTTNAEYMRPPQMIPEQTTKITQFYKPVEKPNFEESTESARILQEQEAEAALTQPIRTPRAQPKVYDYSAITADDISRVEIATQSNNPKKAEEKLKRAIRTYENSNKKQYMSARQALDEYLAKKESERQKK